MSESAYCNGCERKIRLTVAGRLLRHNVRSLGLLCVGSGKTAEEAKLVTW